MVIRISIALVRQQETPYLLVLELDQTRLIFDHLVRLVLTLLEELRQREPLSSHLVPVVRVDELIVVHAVRCVSLDALARGLARVQRDDVVEEALASGREGDRLRRVGMHVLRRGRLADLEVLSWQGRVVREVNLSLRRKGGHCSAETGWASR